MVEQGLGRALSAGSGELAAQALQNVILALLPPSLPPHSSFPEPSRRGWDQAKGAKSERKQGPGTRCLG